MSKTISNSISTGITLTSAYDPLVITTTGTIETSGAAAIYGNNSQYWQITNSGLIDGLGSYGIDLLAASTITNLGTVTSNGIALRIDNGAGRLTNSGTLGGFQDGIALTDGGTVTNTGTIGGILGAGIEIAGDAGTVTNAGTISGHEYAVQFSGSFADRVIVDPGAVFTGKVQGGMGSNTLELAAGTAGATGTLSGFGSSSFINFDTIIVDPGANWQFDATDTISTNHVTLTDQGTLANAGLIDTEVTAGQRRQPGQHRHDKLRSRRVLLYGASLCFGTGGVGTVSNTQERSRRGGTASLLEAGGDVFNGRTIDRRLSQRAGMRRARIINGVGTGDQQQATSQSALHERRYPGSGGSVGNTGTIESSNGDGVHINEGGTVTNSEFDIIRYVTRGVYLEGRRHGAQRGHHRRP